MKRLFYSLIIAMIVHFLVFSFNLKSLKNRYPEQKPKSVAISLVYQQSSDKSDYQRSPRAHEKKTIGRIEKKPAVNPEYPDDTIRSEVPAASGVTPAIVPDDAVQLSKERFQQKYPENIQGNYEKAYGNSFKETPSPPVSGIVKEAVPLYKENPSPDYPLLAKKRGYQGTVILNVLVTKEGKTGKVSVFESSRYSVLDEAAVTSVKKWHFEPGKRGDEKVDMTVKIPIRFKLEAD